MKVVNVFYKCDYCEETLDKPNFKYEDSSGFLNHQYDMCSEECKEKHIEFLLKAMPSKEDVAKHISEFL